MFFFHEKSRIKPILLPTNFPACGTKEEKELFVAKLFLEKLQIKYMYIKNGKPNRMEPDILVSFENKNTVGLELTALTFEPHRSTSSDYPAFKRMCYDIISELNLNMRKFHIQFVLIDKRDRNTIGKLLQSNSKIRKHFIAEFKQFLQKVSSLAKFNTLDLDPIVTDYYKFDEKQYPNIAKYFNAALVAFPCKSFNEIHNLLPQIVFNKDAVRYNEIGIEKNTENLLKKKWKKQYSINDVNLLIYKPNPLEPFCIHEENIKMLNKVFSSFSDSPFGNVYYYEFGLNQNDYIEKLI